MKNLTVYETMIAWVFILFILGMIGLVFFVLTSVYMLGLYW